MEDQATNIRSNKHERHEVATRDYYPVGKKRRRISCSQDENSTIHDLPLEVLKLCLSFVGSEDYRFIAIVSHMFREGYRELCVHCCVTSMKNVVSSIPRVKIFLMEVNGINVLERVVKAAAGEGQLDILKWTKNEDTLHRCGSIATSEASKFGHLDVIKWLYKKNYIDGIHGGILCSGASEGGYLNVLKWWEGADAVGFDLDDYGVICRNAVDEGHLHILRWVKKNKCAWNLLQANPFIVSICKNAASKGHLEILKWARQNNCRWNEWTCTTAADNGHFEVLKWTRQNGCPWDVNVCSTSASNGNLEMLKWARQNECPWDECSCTLAASNGHLEVLKWARQNGCPWDSDTCTAAACNRQLEVLNWARENGCPEDGHFYW